MADGVLVGCDTRPMTTSRPAGPDATDTGGAGGRIGGPAPATMPSQDSTGPVANASSAPPGGSPPELGSLMGRSASRLRVEAMRFLRRFGLLSATWSFLLGLAAPRVDHPGYLWAAIGVHAAWALGSVLVRNDRAWWTGWFVLALGLEAVVPVVGTHGWSITGGSVILVLAGVALSGRRRWVVGTVTALAAVVAVRAVVAAEWPVANGIATILVFAFGALALTWMVQRIAAVVTERDRLQAQLVEVETTAARATERAEAGARLHDTVLQHLTAVSHADDVDTARRHAGRASNELRQFLRLDADPTDSLRALLRSEVTRAADGMAVSVSVVGDRPVGDRERLLVGATLEAVRNAVRHGAPPIRVHAEVARDGDAVVWVGDHGPGFDPAEVDPDRLGVRQSIRGRMQRAGGAADLATDDGAEWELRLPGR